MAGGEGSRIKHLFPDIPKPLIPINGIPVLERELNLLRDQGFDDFIITLHNKASLIKNYFGNGHGISPATGKPFGFKIEYYEEEVPLGNAGALLKLRDVLKEDFLLLNADSIFDVDFNRFVEYHRRKKSLVTLFSHPNSHPFDSAILITDTHNQVMAWLGKKDLRPQYYHNKVNAGIHILNPSILFDLEIHPESVGTLQEDGTIKKVDLDKDILKPLCNKGVMYCYDSTEYVKDMGTEQRYYQVTDDFRKGVPQARNLFNKQKAIFLDRDGTINHHIGFLQKPEEFSLIPGVSKAIKLINNSEYLCVIVTNQPVVARGEVSFEGLDEIHKKMETLLGEQGAYVDGIYFCPHHPHKGFVGEIAELKMECNCRKPKPGLLLKAAEDLNIDLSESFIIGDGDIDVQAGQTAGCKAIKINSNEDNALLEAVESIL